MEPEIRGGLPVEPDSAVLAWTDVVKTVSPRRLVPVLAVLAGVLALLASLAGLFWHVGDAPESLRSVRGEVVELYGEGVYRYDSVFEGAANRGSDLVTLALVLPVLVFAGVAYRRGSVRGALLLSGAFTWLLYLYASLALGAAYNELFLVYVAVFGASLHGLILTLVSVDAGWLMAHLEGSRYRTAVTALLAGAGLVTLVVWLTPLVSSLTSGGAPPLLDHGTTMVTEALDLAIITPAVFLTALWLWRRRPFGYLVAFPLLALMFTLLPMIVSQTAFQLAAGWEFSVPELVGPIGGFLVLGAFAFWAIVSTLRRAR